ncbi:Thrombospondin type-1 domain-containing protein 4 [Triplophysa tibetana]|uniref:Thrombospondin type-1 domain-containing protein 4 n=1 Tax=Triplophysa tibetana TaxID=1572043 RepID=A0A5A9P143_9TELE|nr:Thrombospondin type-1 domain-containing protein 4 [Triplophysa tibetana]
MCSRGQRVRVKGGDLMSVIRMKCSALSIRKSNSGGISPGRNPYVTSDLREHRTHHSDDRSNTRQPSASITSCPGGSHRLKICNNMACPSQSRPIREMQCSVLNARSFMGRLYDWEPFSAGDGEHGCQLHCRAVGFRFYIRQSDDVIDGSSCGQNRSSVCVAGQCERVGCDDVVGSQKIEDRCGVCGGDGKSCQLISGLFQHSLSKVGYHKIMDIPPGARNINITEMMKSRNYLGEDLHHHSEQDIRTSLRSRSGGSIINGNWAIDRPGVFEGVGTMFTYRRPNEISSTAGESFRAKGPTNDILEVYMIYQQPNPGVHYEFLLPSEDLLPSLNVMNGPTPSDPNGRQNPTEDRERSGVLQNPSSVLNHVLPAAPHTHRGYNWKLTGSSDCSATCGRGVRYGVFSCVHGITRVQVQNELCDSSTKPNQQEEPCNIQPCPAFWDMGEWSECSRTCGLGSQHRQVLCRQLHSNRTLTVHAGGCRHLERPETSSTCQLKICSEWHICSDWSPCSVPCGVGQRSRQVECVSNVGDVVSDEECNMKLRPSDVENCDAGPCTRSWFFSDWNSQCSKSCDGGYHVREVRCVSDHMIISDRCDEESKPHDREIYEKCTDKHLKCNVVVQARLCVETFMRSEHHHCETFMRSEHHHCETFMRSEHHHCETFMRSEHHHSETFMRSEHHHCETFMRSEHHHCETFMRSEHHHCETFMRSKHHHCETFMRSEHHHCETFMRSEHHHCETFMRSEHHHCETFMRSEHHHCETFMSSEHHHCETFMRSEHHHCETFMRSEHHHCETFMRSKHHHCETFMRSEHHHCETFMRSEHHHCETFMRSEHHHCETFNEI